jgi:osmoprotectant transport system permease protein
VELFADAWQWLLDPQNYVGEGSLPQRSLEHLGYTMWVMALASAIAIPLGLYIGHTGRGRGWAVGITGAARALPTFGLLLYLVLVIGVERRDLAAVIALVLLAIPPLLAGAYSGVDQIDRQVLDAAKAQGMTGWQLLFRVELPLALPLVVGGIRNAALQVVATVTLIAYVGLGGLGYDIIQGIPLRRFDQMIGSALAIVVIALLLDAVFAALTRVVTPEGVRKAGGGDIRARESSRRLDTRAS